jgi:hypothetical protein
VVAVLAVVAAMQVVVDHEATPLEVALGRAEVVPAFE